jgi:uncharacterized protein
MTSNATRALFDVNVWLALASEHHAHHRTATAALSHLPNPVFCRVTQASLLRLLTNAATMGPNICTSEQAWSIYHRIGEHSGAIFQPEPPGLEHQWRIFTASAQSPSGAAWNDAYLAAFAVCSEIQLATFDTGFKRYRGLDCRLL